MRKRRIIAGRSDGSCAGRQRKNVVAVDGRRLGIDVLNRGIGRSGGSDWIRYKIAGVVLDGNKVLNHVAADDAAAVQERVVDSETIWAAAVAGRNILPAIVRRSIADEGVVVGCLFKVEARALAPDEIPTLSVAVAKPVKTRLTVEVVKVSGV